MKNSKRDYPQVNAGSMADIAFLLLIFFLVTAVIPKDKGINRKLPAPCPPNTECNDNPIHQRNILEIKINANNELLVENEITPIEDLVQLTTNFLDNNGNGSCEYCVGLGDKDLSDHPQKAVVSLANDKQTSYQFYIKVQDEITKAYYDLRSNYAAKHFNKLPTELSQEELKEVKEAYPFMLSEAEIKN